MFDDCSKIAYQAVRLLCHRVFVFVLCICTHVHVCVCIALTVYENAPLISGKY